MAHIRRHDKRQATHDSMDVLRRNICIANYVNVTIFVAAQTTRSAGSGTP